MHIKIFVLWRDIEREAPSLLYNDENCVTNLVSLQGDTRLFNWLRVISPNIHIGNFRPTEAA